MIRRLWLSMLRDYFAAKAMPSKMLSPLPSKMKEGDEGITVAQYVARQSYTMADAMLAERSRDRTTAKDQK